MGCLDGHGGPLPKDWIPQHVELEKKILARERELGMTPVLQGFTGHVPEALLKKFPGTKAQRIHWIEFNTWMLDPHRSAVPETRHGVHRGADQSSSAPITSTPPIRSSR